jgi:hypothetical protein
LQATISAFIADRFGNYNILTGTALNYYPEAGAIISSTATDNSGLSTAVLRTQWPDPVDVKKATITPVADADFADFSSYFGSFNEPWYPTSLGTTRNPRDGWVTVLATTMGEEEFIDENGNGMFTRSTGTSNCPLGYSCECDGGVTDAYSATVSGPAACGASGRRSEGFKDISEPFYDKNDNGKRNDGTVSGYPYEQFIDTNGNGLYDGPNGLWDGPDCIATNSSCQTSKTIWKDIRLVFTDNVFGSWPLPDNNECYLDALPCSASYASGTFAIAPASILKGSSGYFCVYVADYNLNSPPGGTVIAASASTGAVSNPASVTVRNRLSTGPAGHCFSVSVEATDTNSSVDVSATVGGEPVASATVPLTTPPLRVATVVLPDGQFTGTPQAYSATLAAAGGTPPYVTWSIIAGSLPGGLALTPSSGTIAGTPTAAGVFNFTARVTDSTGNTASRALTITVN